MNSPARHRSVQTTDHRKMHRRFTDTVTLRLTQPTDTQSALSGHVSTEASTSHEHELPLDQALGAQNFSQIQEYCASVLKGLESPEAAILAYNETTSAYCVDSRCSVGALLS